MAIISGVVRLDGSGNYTDISAGIIDLVASGLADSTITEFYLYIEDSGPYNGYINIEIPNSGTLYLIGDYTRWKLSQSSSISGISSEIYNFVMENMLIDGGCSGYYLWNQPSGTSYLFQNIDFINTKWGINTSESSLNLTNISASCLNNSGNFVKSINTSLNINDSKISLYDIGISGNELYLINSIIHHNNTNILVPTGVLNSNGSLIYDGDYGIYISYANLNLANTTINSTTPIYSTGTFCTIDTSIMSGVGYCLQGDYLSGCFVRDSILSPSGWSSPNISGSNIINDNPKFNNHTYGDHRLIMDPTNGSKGVEHESLNIPSGMNIDIDQSQFMVFDSKGPSTTYEFIPFIYKQGSTVRFTDYNKEIQFANLMNGRGPLEYSAISTVTYYKNNINVLPSFDIDPEGVDRMPWDWDYVNLDKYNTKIDQPIEYVIPRSHINLGEIIGTDLQFLPEESNILFNKMTKNNIKVWNSVDFRGVSYDLVNSRLNESILWVIEGRNQNLIRHSAFTGEDLEIFPLLAPYPSGKALIKPSGITFTGVEKDKYRFIKNGTTTEIYGQSENGEFLWLPTDINPRFDVRGIYSYKNYLFATCSQYSRDIYNRTVVPYGGAHGQILFFFNNENFEHYIYGHKIFNLISGHAYPTDITVYEDGKFLSLDYYSSGNIYQYKPGYDYALIEQQYDRNTRVLLREQYNDVSY